MGRLDIIGIVDNIEHRGFCARVPWFSAIAVILRYGHENQRTLRNFSIWTVERSLMYTRRPWCGRETAWYRCKIGYLSKFTAAARGSPCVSTALGDFVMNCVILSTFHFGLIKLNVVIMNNEFVTCKMTFKFTTRAAWRISNSNMWQKCIILALYAAKPIETYYVNQRKKLLPIHDR